jgi:hypothetical protein
MINEPNSELSIMHMCVRCFIPQACLKCGERTNHNKKIKSSEEEQWAGWRTERKVICPQGTATDGVPMKAEAAGDRTWHEPLANDLRSYSSYTAAARTLSRPSESRVDQASCSCTGAFRTDL